MSYRISVWLLLLLVSTNAAHVMLGTTGTYDYMGVNPSIGDTSALDQAEQDAREAEVGSGSVTDSFVAVASSIVTVFNGILDNIFLWRPVLKSLGLPDAIVNWGTAAWGFVIPIDLLLLWRGA